MNPFKRLKDHIRKLGADLKPMSFKDKLDHLWTYYKWVAVVLAVVVVIVSASISFYQNASMEPLLRGMLINVDVSLDGYNYLTIDYFERKNGNEDEQKVELISASLVNPMTTTEIEYAYTTIQKFVAEMSTMELDYVLTDLIGLEHCCIANEALLDLRFILTEEELAQLEADGDLIYAQIYDEYDVLTDTMPIAINMRNQPYSKLHVQSTEDAYLGFINNTQRRENCRELWDFLKVLEVPASETQPAA